MALISELFTTSVYLRSKQVTSDSLLYWLSWSSPASKMTALNVPTLDTTVKIYSEGALNATYLIFALAAFYCNPFKKVSNNDGDLFCAKAFYSKKLVSRFYPSIKYEMSLDLSSGKVCRISANYFSEKITL